MNTEDINNLKVGPFKGKHSWGSIIYFLESLGEKVHPIARNFDTAFPYLVIQQGEWVNAPLGYGNNLIQITPLDFYDTFKDRVSMGEYGLPRHAHVPETLPDPHITETQCTCSGAQLMSGMWDSACPYHNKGVG